MTEPPEATLALVDDDKSILTTLSIALQSEGFATRIYSDPQAALRAISDSPPDLAILDIKMPRMDGLELLQKLRERTSVPVIFLTSKDTEIDEAHGLSMGADDYVGKPFSQRLLFARIRAVLRRAEARSTPPEDIEGGTENILERGPLALDLSRHRVLWHGKDVQLTVTEIMILEELAKRPGFVKSRDQLMDAAYEDDVYVDDRTIDSHIKRLRKKFRVVDGDFDAIETLYGVGYRFNDGSAGDG